MGVVVAVAVRMIARMVVRVTVAGGAGMGVHLLPSLFYGLACPGASLSLKLLLETLTTSPANSLTLLAATATISQGHTRDGWAG